VCGWLQVDARVRTAISQRDDSIATLKEQLEECELRRKHVETMMVKQRHELLTAMKEAS
jgi:hypothetical protein